MLARRLEVQPRPGTLIPSELVSPNLVAPVIFKGTLEQAHFILPAGADAVSSLHLDLATEVAACRAPWDGANAGGEGAPWSYPYGLSSSAWWGYGLAPHGYLDLGGGHCQVGLNFCHRFLHLDLRGGTAQLVDPEVGDEFLSTSNWFDPERGEMWFASWPVEATVRRQSEPQAPVTVTIWKLGLASSRLDRIWQGDLGDALHQLALSPDRRFLVLAELGLRPQEAIPVPSREEAAPAWQRLLDGGLIPSQVLFLDLQTGREWRLPLQAAAHVEFDPDDAGICYLSEHNIGLVGTKVGIFGPGSIRKFLYGPSGPEPLGSFTAPGFFRITTHLLFRFRGRTLIGVTGYPDLIFLIDAASMTLYRTLPLPTPDPVDLTRAPHLCQRDSYGIAVTADGETLLVVGSGWIRGFAIASGQLLFTRTIPDFAANAGFTGHLGAVDVFVKATP